MRKSKFKTFIINKKALAAFGISLLMLLYTFVYAHETVMDILRNAGNKFILSMVENTTGLTILEEKDNYVYYLSRALLGYSIDSPENMFLSVSSAFAKNNEQNLKMVENKGNSAKVNVPAASMPAVTEPEEHHEPKSPEGEEKSRELTIEQNSGGTIVNNIISINNQTKLQIDMDYLNSSAPPFKLSKKPKVLIFHTHATESYASSGKNNIEYTDKERTTDENFNVIRVGNELEVLLKKNNIEVIHNKKMHDYPSYNASYNNSYETVEEIIKQNPDICVVIDLHRDAVYDSDNNRIKLTADIGGEKAAQVMSVLGTSELGFKHDNWKKNLKFAYMLQNEYLNINKNFARPINLRSARYNQNLAPGAIIMEVGTSGNSLDEALVSAKYIASALVKTLEKCK